MNTDPRTTEPSSPQADEGIVLSDQKEKERKEKKRESSRKWREKSAEYRREYQAKWRLKNKDYDARWMRNKYANSQEERDRVKELSLKKDPLKKKAADILNNAVRGGKIIKPDVCTRNPNHIGRKIQAHHPDYNKPLEVIWVCAACHRVLHGRTLHTLNMAPGEVSQ